ncbi:MAG: winged helix-turn-helix transcriptional regulator [Methanomassiliicoccus sp.]|nr:winged helix-turn-helix transcriptional regulator [Methanomassiliicoccus sp.]
MDEQDLMLIQMLVRDPRATYRELADGMGMSVQAVHRRLQNLQEAGIILGFTTTISVSYLEAIPITIYGRAPGRTKRDVIAAFDRNERISGVLFGSGGVMVISALLRKITELDPLIAAVKAGTGMVQLWVGIESVRASGTRPSTAGTEPLSPLDMRIVASLARDARKASTDVAKELGVTAATVNRRLERLEAIGALEHVTMLHPGFSGDVVSIFQIDLEEGADRAEVIARLRLKLGPTAEYYRTFVNVPDRFSFVTWNSTLRELELTLDKVAEEKGIRTAVPDIMFTGWYHPTWRDRMVMIP